MGTLYTLNQKIMIFINPGFVTLTIQLKKNYMQHVASNCHVFCSGHVCNFSALFSSKWIKCFCKPRVDAITSSWVYNHLWANILFLQTVFMATKHFHKPLLHKACMCFSTKSIFLAKKRRILFWVSGPSARLDSLTSAAQSFFDNFCIMDQGRIHGICWFIMTGSCYCAPR